MDRHERGDAVELGRARRTAAADDLGPLFGAEPHAPLAAPIYPASAHDDYQTARDAADRVAALSPSLRTRVLELIRQSGSRGMTDLELEVLPEFKDLGFSTVRKRRSENKAAGLLFPSGRRDGATVWVAC